jgi:hypothetical protein
MNLHDGVRTEIRRRFIEGEGHLVEEVEIGAPLAANSARLPQHPTPPPMVVTVADVPLALARQVIEANGLVAVPQSYLTPDQVQELAIEESTPQPEAKPEPPPGSKKQVAEKDAIKRVMAAQSFEELNELTANDNRLAVLNAAEARAAELKA